ncbi:hypothetical protein TSUD_108320 [Trifolium subterraneum]|nr:hypothetical protein TSUD_108320 [Trifolium subterraneum]
MNSQLLDDAEHIISTTPVDPPTAAATAPHPGLPPSRHRRPSHVWNHFIEQAGTEMQAKCNYCGLLTRFKDGTSLI